MTLCARREWLFSPAGAISCACGDCCIQVVSGPRETGPVCVCLSAAHGESGRVSGMSRHSLVRWTARGWQPAIAHALPRGIRSHSGAPERLGERRGMGGGPAHSDGAAVHRGHPVLWLAASGSDHPHLWAAGRGNLFSFFMNVRT